ncbi:P-loop NTPase fold protein [Enterococcus sp. AZ072]|uniref:P-loop NTPase fold protein n=1 Tax=unclassified Enterococcus TaxID=2608891 RepID=UPI003D2E64EC
MKEIKTIDTEEAANNFLKLLSENKTYFLNGVWGSGKTDFIKQVENLASVKTKLKFVYLDLWNVKDERTVTNIAFNNFYRFRSFFFKILVILCVVISILMTDFVNLGFESIFRDSQLWWVLKIGGVVAVWQFFKVKSDLFFNYGFKRQLIFWERKAIKNKVLIIDDFDRVSFDKQQEAYKLFNTLNGKLPIVFLGDFTKVSMNEDNYLQKIIDRYIELPYSLHPKRIWDSYFSELEGMLDFEIKDDLKSLFIHGNRNIREQVHFNDYVNLEFFEREKLGHVQVNQQLLLIYLYLFHKRYYKKMLAGWLPDYTVKETDGDNNTNWLYYSHTNNKIFKSEFEKIIYEILDDNEEYPKGYRSNEQGYFVLESISNLSMKEALDILNDDTQIRKSFIDHGARTDDFYGFMIAKYKKWWPHTRHDQVASSLIRGEKLFVNDEIKWIEELVFQLLREGKMSDLTNWFIDEIVNRDLSYLTFDTNYEQAVYINKYFVEKYLENFDLSQKIHLYNFYQILKHKQVLELFKEQIIEIVVDKVKYQEQKKKAYLLSMLVLNEENHWIEFKDWDETIKSRVSDLDDADFILFWRLYRILTVKNNSLDNKLEEIDKLELYTGRIDPGNSEDIEEQFDREMIGLISGRLQVISAKYDTPLFYTNGKTTRTDL